MEASLEDTWFAGPDLPTVLSRSQLLTDVFMIKQQPSITCVTAKYAKMTFRSCAVSTGSSIIMIGGHNNDSTESLNIMLEMTKVGHILPKSIFSLTDSFSQGGDWTFGPLMLESRRDHACLYLEFERSRGVLVTGGQGANDEVRFSFGNALMIS